jgi:hypothetical protein
MSRLGVVGRRFDPALAGHRRRIEFRRTPGAPEAFSCHIVFGWTIRVVWRRFNFGHLLSSVNGLSIKRRDVIIWFRAAAGAWSRGRLEPCRRSGSWFHALHVLSGREKLEVHAQKRT